MATVDRRRVGELGRRRDELGAGLPRQPGGAEHGEHHEAAALGVVDAGLGGLDEHGDGGCLDEPCEHLGADVGAHRALGDAALDEDAQPLADRLQRLGGVGGVGLAHRHARQEAHVSDRAPESRAEQGDGGGGVGVVGRGGDGVEAFGADVDHGEDQGVAVREVPVEGAPGQARGGGDALEGGVGCLAEGVGGGGEQGFTVGGRVSTWRSTARVDVGHEYHPMNLHTNVQVQDG